MKIQVHKMLNIGSSRDRNMKRFISPQISDDVARIKNYIKYLVGFFHVVEVVYQYLSGKSSF